MVSDTNDPLTFNDLMTTPIDFSKYVLNRLKIDNLTQDLLLGPPLPLQGRPSHLTVAVDYFFNNDLEYLKTYDSEKTYTTSITKTKAARYEIVGIGDMVPTLWSTIKHAYDKDAAKGIKHWGERRKLWYRSQMNKFSKHNVYSIQKILGVKSVSVKKLHEYGHLEEVVMKRADRQLYKFEEDVKEKVNGRRQKEIGAYGRVDKQMRERRIIRNLERLVGARDLEMYYKLMTHSHHGPSDAMHNPFQPLKVSQKTLVSFLTEIKHISVDSLTLS
ncbi:hypothetical protein Tco_1292722 [Tanacetum coccineum]